MTSTSGTVGADNNMELTCLTNDVLPREQSKVPEDDYFTLLYSDIFQGH